MVRIGEALTSLGMIDRGAAATKRSRSSSSDRSVPLGELLVRMGVVSREDLQIALARKMGYPLGRPRQLPGRGTTRCASCRYCGGDARCR